MSDDERTGTIDLGKATSYRSLADAATSDNVILIAHLDHGRAVVARITAGIVAQEAIIRDDLSGLAKRALDDAAAGLAAHAVRMLKEERPMPDKRPPKTTKLDQLRALREGKFSKARAKAPRVVKNIMRPNGRRR